MTDSLQQIIFWAYSIVTNNLPSKTLFFAASTANKLHICRHAWSCAVCSSDLTVTMIPRQEEKMDFCVIWGYAHGWSVSWLMLKSLCSISFCCCFQCLTDNLLNLLCLLLYCRGLYVNFSVVNMAVILWALLTVYLSLCLNFSLLFLWILSLLGLPGMWWGKNFSHTKCKRLPYACHIFILFLCVLIFPFPFPFLCCVFETAEPDRYQR